VVNLNKRVLTIIFLLLTINVCAIEPSDINIEGKAGLELTKVENGPLLITPAVRGLWHFNDNIDFKAEINENFSNPSGQVASVPNHHSWCLDFGISYRLFESFWVEWRWSNRSLIRGHDSLFLEEFSNNRNVLGLYTKF